MAWAPAPYPSTGAATGWSCITRPTTATRYGEQNLNVTLPVVLSSRGYLLLFDHYAASYLDLGKKKADVLEYGAQGLNSLSYFVVTGYSQAEILDRYTALTGRQPLPPPLGAGPHPEPLWLPQPS